MDASAVLTKTVCIVCKITQLIETYHDLCVRLTDVQKVLKLTVELMSRRANAVSDVNAEACAQVHATLDEMQAQADALYTRLERRAACCPVGKINMCMGSAFGLGAAAELHRVLELGGALAVQLRYVELGMLASNAEDVRNLAGTEGLRALSHRPHRDFWNKHFRERLSASTADVTAALLSATAASPDVCRHAAAAMSRGGVVTMEAFAKELGAEPLVERWLAARRKSRGAVAPAHAGRVTRLLWRRGSLTSASSDGIVKTFESVGSSIAVRHVLIGHERGVTDIAFGHDSVLSASADRTVRAWSALDGAQTACLPCRAAPCAVCAMGGAGAGVACLVDDAVFPVVVLCAVTGAAQRQLRGAPGGTRAICVLDDAILAMGSNTIVRYGPRDTDETCTAFPVDADHRIRHVCVLDKLVLCDSANGVCVLTRALRPLDRVVISEVNESNYIVIGIEDAANHFALVVSKNHEGVGMSPCHLAFVDARAYAHPPSAAAVKAKPRLCVLAGGVDGSACAYAPSESRLYLGGCAGEIVWYDVCFARFRAAMKGRVHAAGGGLGRPVALLQDPGGWALAVSTGLGAAAWRAGMQSPQHAAVARDPSSNVVSKLTAPVPAERTSLNLGRLWRRRPIKHHDVEFDDRMPRPTNSAATLDRLGDPSGRRGADGKPPENRAKRSIGATGAIRAFGAIGAAIDNIVVKRVNSATGATGANRRQSGSYSADSVEVMEEQRLERRRSVEMTLDARLRQDGSVRAGTVNLSRAKFWTRPVEHGIPQTTRVMCIARCERSAHAWVVGHESGLLLLNAEMDVVCWTRTLNPVVSVHPLSGNGVLVETRVNGRGATGYSDTSGGSSDADNKTPKTPQRLLQRQWSSKCDIRQVIYGANLQPCDTFFPAQCTALAADGCVVVMSFGINQLLLHDIGSGVKIAVSHDATGAAVSACFTPAGFLTLHAHGEVLVWELPVSDIEPVARRRIDADVLHLRYHSGHVLGLGASGTLYLYDADATRLLFCHVTHAGVPLTGAAPVSGGLLCCDAGGALVPVELRRPGERALL
jgi:hypothetical protein